MTRWSVVPGPAAVPPGGSGSYAIRALPDLCFGITSELRRGVKLIFPPDHSGIY